MKLTKKKLIELLRIMEEGGTAYRAKIKIGVSIERAYQIWNEYKKTGKIPELGKSIGRPPKAMLSSEEEIVRKSYEKYRMSASRIVLLIERDYKIQIPVYTIHKILLKLGFAKKKGEKDVRNKKWIRYERRHSLTATHGDWVYNKKLKLWALPIIDDASRKLLALKETNNPTTDESIDAIKEAMKHGEIQQFISDHGTQFIKDETKRSRFTEFLETNNIKHILCRIKHPQSNGKSEKFGHLYLVHRTAFKTKEEFIKWYNEVRPHMSLNELETPEQAYQRKKKIGRRYYT